MKLKCVIFDFDGTLFDSMYLWDTVAESYVRSRGKEPKPTVREEVRALSLLQAAAEAGNEDAELAIRAYCYSIKKYIGSYAAAMGGLDAIVFGGGIGLGSALVRALSLEGLEFLGVKLDGFKNRMAIAGMDISMEDAPVRVFTVHTDEEIIVARKAAALLQKQA